MAGLYEELDCLITFSSVHQAIAAERSLRTVQIAHAPLPTPREISVSCGQSIAIRRETLDQVLQCLMDAKICWSKVFSRDSRLRSYEQIVARGE